MRIATIIPQDSTWLLTPTPKQGTRIAKLAQILGIKETIEGTPSTRYEARALIYGLLMETKLRRKRESSINSSHTTKKRPEDILQMRTRGSRRSPNYVGRTPL